MFLFCIRGFMEDNKKLKYKKEYKFMLIYFLTFIVIYLITGFVFNDFKRYLFLTYGSILFYIARLIIIMPFSLKERSKKNIIIRYIIWLLLLIIPVIIMRYHMVNNNYFPLINIELDENVTSENIISINEESDGKFVLKVKDNFKILQVTDLHIGASEESYDLDLKAGETIRNLIYKSKPDLIVITGDLIYPIEAQSFSDNNNTMFLGVFDFFERFGIPWTFTLGNHDFEITNDGGYGKVTPKELIKYSANEYKNLLISEKFPDIYGRYNNIIEIRNEDDSLNQVLYLIDSNSYKTDNLNDYDYIHSDQIDWYENSIKEYNEKENKIVSSMMFFHIPLQEFQDAYNALISLSPDAELLFGEHREKTCSSNTSSGLFEKVLELGSTKAIFCGHDHFNDIGIKYKGIDLVYGKSIDYLAYPGIDKKTEQRGGTLITLNSDSTYTINQIEDK
mgnify:CR=1 FL=1